MSRVVKIVLNAIAVLVASYLLAGVVVESFLTAIVVAVVMSILNVFLKPVLQILTIPITVITLGIFLLILNGLLVLLADWLIPGFYVEGIWSAILFSLIVSFVNWVTGAKNED